MKTRLLAAVAAAALFASSAAPAAGGLRTAVFAGGCFWSVEKAFEAQPGVVSAVSGYAGGMKPNPSYEDHSGYLEAVKVTYDPAKVSYAQLVDYFFHHIDPTDPYGQICDHGPSYMTAIFTTTAEEKQVAEAAKVEVGKTLGAKIITVVRNSGLFYDAEGYHQDFAKKNPARYEAYRVGCGRDRVLQVVWGGR